MRRAGAEGLAAFALVFAGCGAIVANDQYDGALGTVGIALVFGLIIMVMVYATGHLSGAHINPAVTIAFTLTRHFPSRDALAYVAAQIVGATAGALRCSPSGPTSPPASARRCRPSASDSALVYEVAADRVPDVRDHGRRHRHPGGRGCGRDRDRRHGRARRALRRTGDRRVMNPARSFGPALAAGEWTDFWVYLVGPVLGAAVGAFAYQLVRGEQSA